MPNEKSSVNSEQSLLVNLNKYSKKKTGFINEVRRLIITIGLFLFMQVIFISIEGTFLEPNLNNIGHFVSRLVENSFFTKWFILYDNPVFIFITIIGLLHITYVLIKTVILKLNEKDRDLS